MLHNPSIEMMTIPFGFVTSTWQVLTRRDQLTMKEDKQKKRKLAEQEKKAKKEAESKPKRRRSAKKDEKETTEPEVEEKELQVVKPRRRLRQMKTMDCIPEEPSAEEPEPKAASCKPAKTKSRAKAKPKRESKKTKKVVPKTPEQVDNEASESDGQQSAATPKKELFQSDDDGGDESPHHRFDQKSGKVMPLQKVLDNCQPEAHMTTRRQRAKRTVPATASGASMGDAEETEKPKRKPRKKKAPTSPGALSPFAKKEVKRRESQGKKEQDSVMKNAAREDLQIQGLILQHLKNVDKITEEDEVKKYLVDSLKDKTLNKEYRLNEYWKRPAVGVKAIGLGDGSLKGAPEVAYFGKSCVGACPNVPKLELTVMYVAASLMVFRINYFCGNFWHIFTGSQHVTVPLLTQRLRSAAMLIHPKPPYSAKSSKKASPILECIIFYNYIQYMIHTIYDT